MAIAIPTALAAVLWILQAIHWNSSLDGDSALYSLMSLDVLGGRHYLHTAGQAHGGTPLVYARALLFELAGASPFTGFFINGVVVVCATALWARFARQVAGPVAAAVTGTLAAVGSSIFVQYSCTDYYALALLSGGLMLALAARLAPAERITPAWAAAAGALLGFSFYVCRFTPLYALTAGFFFLALASPRRRAELLPSWEELWKRKSMTSRALVAALAINTALFIPAFFANDRFLGINAEVTLKISAKLAAALWLLHRWRLFFGRGGAWPALAAFAAALVAGLAPELAFRAVHTGSADRTTGLVRWEDLAPLLSEFPQRLGANFSRPYPRSLGMAAALSSAAILGLGLIRPVSRLARGLTAVAALGVLPAFASWLLIHTYMYLVVQYFYPTCFPLYLAVGIAAASTAMRKTAAALLVPVLAAGAVDLHRNFSMPNHRLESGVFEKLREWGLREGTGDFWSTYDMMWASKAEFTLDPLYASRFPHFQQRVAAAPRLGYVYRAGDAVPEAKKRYRVVRSAELRHGYRVEELCRSSEAGGPSVDCGKLH